MEKTQFVTFTPDSKYYLVTVSDFITTVKPLDLGKARFQIFERGVKYLPYFFTMPHERDKIAAH